MERLDKLLRNHAINARLDERLYGRREFVASTGAALDTDKVRQAIIDHVTSLVEAAKKESEVQS